MREPKAVIDLSKLTPEQVARIKAGEHPLAVVAGPKPPEKP